MGGWVGGGWGEVKGDDRGVGGWGGLGGGGGGEGRNHLSPLDLVILKSRNKQFSLNRCNKEDPDPVTEDAKCRQ